MIIHKLCRPPRGVKIVATLLPPIGRSPGRFAREDTGRPGLAFLSEDKKDNTSATIWIAACACVGAVLTCPHTRAWNYATRRYDRIGVITRPAVPAATALGIKSRCERRR